MRPTLAADKLREGLLQYLSTTYALSDEGTRRELERFLGDGEAGMFRGPFLRVRTPFQTAEEGWQRYLDWVPAGFTPYRHQAKAFERLSTLHGPALPTLVTTGTGSGKTESFLLPILDHCRRAHLAAESDGKSSRSVKVILLYPMNALATDQAGRINTYLEDPELADVTAGIYIGDKAATTYHRVFTERNAIRQQRPDILITNYKMLDLLLQRTADVRLWEDCDLKYLVVDEFHTYDGAQGTDVAMLLRRLAAMIGTSEDSRPLGGICPVATSATLGGVGAEEREGQDDSRSRLLEVAGQVFGTVFTPNSVVVEDRVRMEHFTDELDYSLPLPGPDEICALEFPAVDSPAATQLAELVTGLSAPSPHELGAALRGHILTKAVLEALGDVVATPAQVLPLMARAGAYTWGQAIVQRRPVAAEALSRYLALLSTARDPDSSLERPRPLVHIEVHQWARSVARVLRGIGPFPEFRWDEESSGALLSSRSRDPRGADAVPPSRLEPAEATLDTAPTPASAFLPAIYCRECGRSGWAVFSKESSPSELVTEPAKIRRASVGKEKRRIRNLISATREETRQYGLAIAQVASTRGKASGVATGAALMVLDRYPDSTDYHLRPVSPEQDLDPDNASVPRTHPDTAFVHVMLAVDKAAVDDRCPACDATNAIRYLGTGPAALAAASITQLFTDGELNPDKHERKTLMFNASVQDAAHRAGFVANRAFTFSLRAVLRARLHADQPVALNDLIGDLVGDTTDPRILAAIVPPDMHDLVGVRQLLSGCGTGDARTWRLIGERLAFSTLLEFGLRSRQGRTLELTRTAAAEVPIEDPEAVSDLVRSLRPSGQDLLDGFDIDEAAYLGYVRGILERLRTRGAIHHHWLDEFITIAGVDRWSIWGGRPRGMPAFPRYSGAPTFLLADRKPGSDFDFASGRLSWHERWTQRTLGLTREASHAFVRVLLPSLADNGVLASRVASDGSTRVYGLNPGHIRARLLTDEQVNSAAVVCNVCPYEQTVHPDQHHYWVGQCCPVYTCTRGRLEVRDLAAARVDGREHHRPRSYRDDYYRRLYRGANAFQIVTAEHTGMLTRAQREEVEEKFRAGANFSDPNVLSCTPTLELGIDIGDLSAVVLAALPKGPANYVQQVGRAGRRSGNALLLTLADRSYRDLYYLADPTEMIQGRIAPPGCYLSAVELLRRQYLAHLIDLAARGRLLLPEGTPLPPLPRYAAKLFGASGWLGNFADAALAAGGDHVDRFLALFPACEDPRRGVSPQAEADLRAFATGTLQPAMIEAAAVWAAREADLRQRLLDIDAASAELQDTDPKHRQLRRELSGERRGVGKRLSELSRRSAQDALVELGLLPNYTLIDHATGFEATLYWEEVDLDTGRKRYDSELREYERSRRLALFELAPGNSFYVNGFRHSVSGLDIGSAKRPGWEQWRICPSCGYVRTHQAETDTSPCPRCQETDIADLGNLHKVVQPTRVTSRDKREDARVRDDKDERDRRFYTRAVAVDIPGQLIDRAWRHSTATFGVDFTRHATIRTFNLGPARADVENTDDFAGQSVHIDPFYVCTACGAATSDALPDPDPRDESDSLAGAVTDKALKHHRPWCPRRRVKPTRQDKDRARDIDVILAHELRTEALRILIPAATGEDPDKLYSFQAALLGGITHQYGGNPDHLAVVAATMPDQVTGHTRNFLVLHDTLPGGTGYLHRLADSNAFLEVLTSARDALLRCPCREQGLPACHRCMLRYTESPYYKHVSQATALETLYELLGEGTEYWSVQDTVAQGGTAAIGLAKQVESELEGRFLGALIKWADNPDVDASLHDVSSVRDGHTADLRISSAGAVVRWKMTLQKQFGQTRTDLSFKRLDGPALEVAVYLDGYHYHATPTINRLADDATKRTRLRAEGKPVFQFTWDDVEDWIARGDKNARAQQVWPPYSKAAQDAARNLYTSGSGRARDLDNYVWANPIDTLLSFLADPATGTWAKRAAAAAAGLLAVPGAHKAIVGRSTLPGMLPSLLAGASTSADSGDLHLITAIDDNGCRLVVAIDAAAPNGPVWSALTVLDDDLRPETSQESRRAWRAWLYWSNLLQFLDAAGGDGVQLTTSQIPSFDVGVLAIAGGAGWIDSIAPTGPDSPVPPAQDLDGLSRREPAWERILQDLDPGDQDLAALVRALAGHEVPLPVDGYELGHDGWQAELAWPERKVAVLLAPRDNQAADGTDYEARDRAAAYAQAGWIAHPAIGWTLESLIAELSTDAH